MERDRNLVKMGVGAGIVQLHGLIVTLMVYMLYRIRVYVSKPLSGKDISAANNPNNYKDEMEMVVDGGGA